jgi:hypothetical protein
MTDTTDRLRALYRAFNAREIDTVLEQMTGDVDWPNACFAHEQSLPMFRAHRGSGSTNQLTTALSDSSESSAA